MLHHVAMEVRPDQMVAEGDFWLNVGFSDVAAPDGLGEGFVWYERMGTQVHLMETENPTAPPARGHIAIVATDFDESIAKLQASGRPVTEGRPLWGERRAKTVSPAGYTVELMAAPPRSSEEAS